MSDRPSPAPEDCSVAGKNATENGVDSVVNGSSRASGAVPPGDAASAKAEQKASSQAQETAKPQAESSTQQTGQAPPMARAEEIVDRFAERVASFTSTWGRRVWRLGARVREEAEDIWGEAQSIRRGDQS